LKRGLKKNVDWKDKNVLLELRQGHQAGHQILPALWRASGG
jgi:hypothetical protein